MTFDISLLIIAVALGAILQVGIGIGFSIIAGPLLMLQLGTQTAVPLLLLMNVIVSVVATPGAMPRKDFRIIALSSVGCLIGVGAGILIYSQLTDANVLAITATLLLLSVAASVVPLHVAGRQAYLPIAGLSGLATVWAATPGPLMALGLILSGYPAQQVRKMVQPVALVAYGAALILHEVSEGDNIAGYPHLTVMIVATVIGSVIGRWVGPKMPQKLIISGIRIVSLFAAFVLFYHAATYP
jgi:uncharacterized membrane protein YfcA